MQILHPLVKLNMKELNFQPAKSKEEFRKNYKLHDLAEYHGKNLLLQWGIDFKDFGEDRRYEKVWEKGQDKPDLVAEHNNKQFLIDWKGKAKESFWVNKRAVESYKKWSEKLNLPAFICFFFFDQYNQLSDRRFSLLAYHKFENITDKAWDKNNIVKFENDLPKFTKENLIKFLNKNF
jgi:Holliday junction resolvase